VLFEIGNAATAEEAYRKVSKGPGDRSGRGRGFESCCEARFSKGNRGASREEGENEDEDEKTSYVVPKCWKAPAITARPLYFVFVPFPIFPCY